ncbi:hypothetical protein RUND412_005746 [Rhizina undulata]
MKAVFRKRLSGPGHSLPSLKASVLKIRELSFQELSENARHLLQLCAFLNNKDIPEELFRRGKSAVSWIMEALGTPTSKYMLAIAWARELTDNTMQRQTAEETITLVASEIRTKDYKRISDDWIFERRIFSRLNVQLTGRELGYHKQAEALYQNAMARMEKTIGKDHLDTLKTVHCMELVFEIQGRYNEALEWFQRSLARREKAFGKDNPRTLSTVHCMATVFKWQKQYDEALKWYQRSLAGREKALQKDHPNILATVQDMAFIFDMQGRYDEALEWYWRSLATQEKELGKDRPTPLSPLIMSHRSF